MTRKIAFIGTGLMGAPMARRLLGAGFQVRVWNRDLSKAEALLSDGAIVAASPSEAVENADIVFTMLSDGNAVGSVLFENGVASALKEGAIVIDTSSIAPTIAREHSKKLEAIGIRHIDCPVSGGTVGAEAGNLALMAGGDEKLVAELADVFAPLGRVTHVGPSGSGQICKLANQQIVAITIGAVAEAMILVEAGGADRGKFRDAIRGGFAESRILELHGQRMVDRMFQPGGPSRLQLKDLDAVASMAKKLSLQLPLTEEVHREFRSFVESGNGNTDHSGILLYMEKINNREHGKNDE